MRLLESPACQLGSWRANGRMQADVLHEPIAPQMRTPAYSPSSGITSHRDFPFGHRMVHLADHQSRGGIRGGGRPRRERAHGAAAVAPRASGSLCA